jgi:hypothetical protein
MTHEGLIGADRISFICSSFGMVSDSQIHELSSVTDALSLFPYFIEFAEKNIHAQSSFIFLTLFRSIHLIGNILAKFVDFLSLTSSNVFIAHSEKLG